MKRLSIWLSAQPLAALSRLEALLLFWNLDLLSPWFDEADPRLFMHGPLAQAIAMPASGLHPPLYFLLLWCWMRLPLGLGWTGKARTPQRVGYVGFYGRGTPALDATEPGDFRRA